jgi:hypothetical protein
MCMYVCVYISYVCVCVYECVYVPYVTVFVLVDLCVCVFVFVSEYLNVCVNMASAHVRSLSIYTHFMYKCLVQGIPVTFVGHASTETHPAP